MFVGRHTAHLLGIIMQACRRLMSLKTEHLSHACGLATCMPLQPNIHIHFLLPHKFLCWGVGTSTLSHVFVFLVHKFLRWTPHLSPLPFWLKVVAQVVVYTFCVAGISCVVFVCPCSSFPSLCPVAQTSFASYVGWNIHCSQPYALVYGGPWC